MTISPDNVPEAQALREQELKESQKKAREQLSAAYKGCSVKCSCGKVSGPVFKLYRCYYCGVFFCDICAAEHFGKTREEHNREHYQEYMVPRIQDPLASGLESEQELERRAGLCDVWPCVAEPGAKGYTNCVNCGAELIEKDGKWYHWSQFDHEHLGEPQDYVR
jgi:hypothetical protein